MAGFMKIDGIDGEGQDSKHDKWIVLESMSSGVHRSIPEGAKSTQRSRGETSMADIVVVRHLDKSSMKLKEACATGKYVAEVQIELCHESQGKNEPYLKYKLKDVILSSYSFHGAASGDPLPTEELTLNYTEGEFTYVEFDNAKGTPKGSIVGKYVPGKHATS
jgi:type VI secretion system secreted protein Hcp